MRHNILLIYITTIAMMISTTTAFPEILDIFNTEYNTTGTRLDTCDTCHTPGLFQITNLNPYGISVKGNLNIEINKALVIIEPLDSDGDGFTNIDEIYNLTFPGNKSNFPMFNIAPNLTLLSGEDKRISRINNTEATNNNATTENNATVLATVNSTSVITIAVPTQKTSGFEIVTSILSILIIWKMLN